MSDANFNFLNKIPDQCGYLVISDGALIKSDGDLSNREMAAAIAEKMLSVSRSTNALPAAKFTQMTVHFGTHFYTISQSGKHIYVVKRRAPAA